VEVSPFGKENGELELKVDLLDLVHKKHHSYINVNQDINVTKDMIIGIFPDGQEVKQYNIQAKYNVSDLVTAGEIHVKVVHYGTDDME